MVASIQTVAFDPLYDTVPNLDTPHAQTKNGPSSGYKKVIQSNNINDAHVLINCVLQQSSQDIAIKTKPGEKNLSDKSLVSQNDESDQPLE